MRFYDRKEIKDLTSYLAVINNENDILRFRRIVNEPKRGIGDSTLSLINDITSDLGLSPIEVMKNAGDYPLLSKKAGVLKAAAEMFSELQSASEEMPLDEFFDFLLERTGYLEYMKSLGDDGLTKLGEYQRIKIYNCFIY